MRYELHVYIFDMNEEQQVSIDGAERQPGHIIYRYVGEYS